MKRNFTSHQVISYCKTSSTTLAYFTHEQQVALPLLSLTQKINGSREWQKQQAKPACPLLLYLPHPPLNLISLRQCGIVFYWGFVPTLTRFCGLRLAACATHKANPQAASPTARPQTPSQPQPYAATHTSQRDA